MKEKGNINKTFFRTRDSLADKQMWDILCVWSGDVFYLVVVYQVENQVNVSMYWLVLSQLRFHSVQPVNESLESICKLAGEQQGLLKLVLSAEEHISLTLNEEGLRSTATSSY